jgi:hypothetical protein
MRSASLLSAQGFLKSGRIKALAVASNKRLGAASAAHLSVAR